MAKPLTLDEQAELAKLRAQLQAPAPQMQPHEHALAHARAAIQRLSDDLWTLATCVLHHAEAKENANSQRYFEFAKAAANRAFDLADANENHEPWKAIYPHFDELSAGLAEPHTGDCTAVACPCTRCHAERLYRVPSTVTWRKHDGYRMLSRMTALAEHECATAPAIAND